MSFVELDRNQTYQSMEGQAMLLQHSIEQSETQGEPRGHAAQEGIVVA